MGTPERNSITDRFSSMSVPERLSVDPDDLRTRKNSDLSNTSDNMMVPDRLLVDDMTNPYHVPHLDTPPRVLTVGDVKRRSHVNTNGSVSAPIPAAPNFEQDEDILTLANRILALHQKVITLENRLNMKTESSFTGAATYYFKIFGISLAAAFLVQFLSKR